MRKEKAVIGSMDVFTKPLTYVLLVHAKDPMTMANLEGIINCKYTVCTQFQSSDYLMNRIDELWP